MSIIKRQSSKYYYIRFTLRGRVIDESTKTTCKIEATRYEAKRYQEVYQEMMFGIKPEKTWNEAKTEWLIEKKHKRSIHEDIAKFEWLDKHFGKKKLSELTTSFIEEVAREKENIPSSPATVNRLLALIKSVLRKAHLEWEWIDKVPHIRMRHEDNERIRWITKEEYARLDRELVGLPHLRDMVEFTLINGPRSSNVSKIEWSWIDYELRLLRIPAESFKQAKHHTVPLNDRSIEILNRWRGKHPKFVFTYEGEPITSYPNTRAFKKALERAGIKDFHWHDLRHTWASWKVQSGTSLHKLMLLAGWTDIKSAMRYAHLLPEHLREDHLHHLKELA